MTIDSPRPNRPSRLESDDWALTTYPHSESERGGRMGYVVAFLMFLAVAVLCVAGVFLVRVLKPDSTPVNLPSFITQTPLPSPEDRVTDPPASPTIPNSPGDALITINPEQGTTNTLISVTGEGWWAGEPVFVFLRSPEEGDGRGYAYAAAVADESGSLRTALTFPNEVRWIGQQWADVIARGNRSGFEASARFTLIPPTPTNTRPPPTPRPTLAPTRTPAPTDTPLPTGTPTPTATPTPELVITEWKGEYFANATVTGDPVLVRNDPFVDFNWGAGSPGEGIPVDSFSARWTRLLEFQEGTYRFSIKVDDGVRFWIDGNLFVDEWQDGYLELPSVEINLSAGIHALQLDFYEHLGGAMVQLMWEQVGVPTVTPTPTLTPSPDVMWRGEYYANQRLSGEPVLVRQDADLNFDWGRGSPAEGVPANSFSVRWTRDAWLSAGTYRIYLQVDEGARYWLDGHLLIDEWHKSTGETYIVDVYVEDGVHSVKVEYYEGGGEASIHLQGERGP